jgi:hypothetical protein
MKQFGQGRPIGHLWAWIVWGQDPAHCAATGGDSHRDYTPVFADRLEGRVDGLLFLAALPPDSNFRRERRVASVGDGPQGEPIDA